MPQLEPFDFKKYPGFFIIVLVDVA
jgi:hypothetical protein